MTKKQLIENEFQKNLNQKQLANKNEILDMLWEIRSFQPMLNSFDNYYEEITQLLYNSIFLYENGLFDNALFNIRACYELSISTIDIEINNKINSWNNKEHFSLRDSLKRLESDVVFKNYREIFKEYFNVNNKIINKVIHKQGYDNFYSFYNYDFKPASDKPNFDQELHNMICIAFLTHIFRNPMSYLLFDEEIYYRTNKDDYLLAPKTNIELWEKYLKIEKLEEKLEETILIKTKREEYMKNDKMSEWIFKFINRGTIDVSEIDGIDNIEKSTLNEIQKLSIWLIKNKIVFNELFSLIIFNEFFLINREEVFWVENKNQLISSLGLTSEIDNYFFSLYKNISEISVNIPFENCYITFVKYENENYMFSHEEPVDEPIFK